MNLQPLDPDEVDRTALLGVHLGTEPTLESSVAAKERTGIIVCADQLACTDSLGQAALMTAVLTGVRAFGTVHVLLESPVAPIDQGVFRGRGLGAALAGQGATLVSDTSDAPASWPIILIGPTTAAPTTPHRHVTLRSVWEGWIARVTASASPVAVSGPPCVLAAIGSAALAVSEAFGAVLNRPGSDAGYRNVFLNFWKPSSATNHGPQFKHAPQWWWLVGLGHLGQAYGWVISLIPYSDPSAVEVMLQDTDATVPANHSTGVFTPRGSRGVKKTRLTSAALETAGFRTFMFERRLDETQRALPSDAHVALLGVDNLHARRLISGVEWAFAVDVGLGSGATNYDSILLRRFPGDLPSHEIAAWSNTGTAQVSIPTAPAFQDMESRFETCGIVELAGKAVGASFVGVIAAVFAVAEATRELHGGRGLDVLSVNLGSDQIQLAESERAADVFSVPLRTE
jgi:hypothetical protein